MGAVLQGVYQLTSVGLSITKKTSYYPLVTGLTLAGNLSANLLLIPRFGIMGAAYANVLTYCILAAAGMAASQRQYPIRYEWMRAVKITIAGVASYTLGPRAPRWNTTALSQVWWAGASSSQSRTPATLFVLGFFRHTEIARLLDILRIRRRSLPHRSGAERTKDRT